MSFLQGMNQSDTIGAIVQRRRDDQATDVVGQWMVQNGQLHQRLAAANEKILTWETSSVQLGANYQGERGAVAVLREALAKVNPNHPLLADGALNEARNVSGQRYAAEKGFAFDPANGVVRRR